MKHLVIDIVQPIRKKAALAPRDSTAILALRDPMAIRDPDLSVDRIVPHPAHAVTQTHLSTSAGVKISTDHAVDRVRMEVTVPVRRKTARGARYLTRNRGPSGQTSDWTRLIS
jgi:hypothetical protein